jgi:hypothetical protein
MYQGVELLASVATGDTDNSEAAAQRFEYILRQAEEVVNNGGILWHVVNVMFQSHTRSHKFTQFEMWGELLLQV